MYVLEALTIAHIAVAAAWFGHKLLIPRDVRTSVRDVEAGRNLIPRIQRAQTLGLTTGTLTLATGVWLMIETTGFAGAPLQIHIALGVVVMMFLVGFFLARPAWNRIRSAVVDGDTPSAAGGVSAFNRALALESLLWVLALTMMVI